MENVILTIHLILALLLIGVVLLQRSEGGGLGIGGGGGGTMSARGAATAMTKLTWLFAVAFIITSITLTILATRGRESGSVVDNAATTTNTVTEPPTETPAPGGGLAGTDLTLPGTATDAPATPPRADEPAPATNP
ncbi:preprotein translocase subunit SecG [Tabrizicola sp.]|uniref:preprotein translocase subunit SecG n=1 Tax=Tabrizicola sp. TaxID=2005166 RepID=UPI0027357642|nr:preprotein translocase subunit SecG [Tabrizicola sp.]MDP3194880.1 preprotein translocase subunit SecG [Tabrizicola sp.]